MKISQELADALCSRFLHKEASTKVGVYPDIANDDYHAGDGVSRSILLAMEESPYDCFAVHLDPERPRKHQAVRHGTLAHCAIFEPDQFHARYAVAPSGDDVPKKPNSRQREANKPSPDTMAAIAWWDEFNARNSGKEIISSDQYDTAMMQAESVLRHAQIQQILSEGEPEVSVYWEDEKTGILCRCRPDWVRVTGNGGSAILVDGKTYATANPESFVRQIERSNYHVQAAFYSDGYAAATGRSIASFPFITVKDTYPYTCSISELDKDSMEAGRAKYRRRLDAFSACIRAGEWPGFDGINLIAMNRWKIESDMDGTP